MGAALDDLFDFFLVRAQLALVDFVEHAVADALDEPDFVGAVGVLEAVEDEAAERSHSHAGTDEHHGAVGVELAG